MVVNIGFATINVNGQRRNASITVGENSQGAWSAHEKKNYGYGILFGVNTQVNIVNTISDLDGVDAPIRDNDFVQSNQNQSA
jgi:hypothetical protein